MKVHLHPPFNAQLGDIVEIPLAGKGTVEDFCHQLVRYFPQILAFLPPGERKATSLLSYAFFAVRQREPERILLPLDIINEEDTLEIMPPFDGG